MSQYFEDLSSALRSLSRSLENLTDIENVMRIANMAGKQKGDILVPELILPDRPDEDIDFFL